MSFRFYLKNLGCKVNQWEGERIAECLSHWGALRLFSAKDCEVIIINGCTVTHRSEAKVRSLVRGAIRSHPRAQVFLTGCGAEDLAASSSLPPSAVISQTMKTKAATLVWESVTGHPPEPPPASGQSLFPDRSRAWVKVQDGCDARCAYCRVPLARPGMNSRPEAEILSEIEILSQRGVMETVLCGTRLGAYGTDLPGSVQLPGLIHSIATVFPGRIRLSSLEPMDLSQDMIEKMFTCSRLCQHLHLPLQSGDDRVLNRMRRRHSLSDLSGCIRCARRLHPHLGFTTDLIAGFPGETEEAHQKSCEALRMLSPHRVHVFPFSPRPGTLAASWPQDPPMSVRVRRAQELRDVAQNVSLAWREGFLNRTVDVLWESRTEDGSHGRSSQDVETWGPEGCPGILQACRVSENLSLGWRVEASPDAC